MLPKSARLRSSVDFRRTVRQGVRVGRPTVVVHAGRHAPEDLEVTRVGVNRVGVTRVGVVVPRAVGSAVARNRVKRRLRHLAAARLDETPRGVDLVLRALPRSATAGAQLSDDLAQAWVAAVRRLESP